jgi:L-arabinokinase
VTVAFYISGHGFGHASRSITVINALVEQRPGTRVIIRSQVAPWLVSRTARPGVGLDPVQTDTGVVQADSLNLDEVATLAGARAFMATFEERVAAEAEWLAANNVALVVADLPPLGLAAARAAGLPGIALGNFTWDWIYSGYAGSDDLVEAIGNVYRQTTLALRLPMWGGFATMPAIVDVPFVARRSSREPDETRRVLGLPLNERLALVSFGGYGVAGLDVEALRRLKGYRVLLPGDVNEPAMYEQGLRYEDLVRAVDVVVSKPGYGIVSECLANDTALLYTSRGHFVEYDVLVAAMPHFLRAAFIGQADLFSGNWTSHLDRLLGQPAPPEQPATNGADVAATRILELIGDKEIRLPRAAR